MLYDRDDALQRLKIARSRITRLHNEFTAVFERDGEWYIAYCPEIPGANGQGHTKDEARQSLADAIAMILEGQPEHRRRRG